MSGLGDVLRADHDAVKATLLSRLQRQESLNTPVVIHLLGDRLRETLEALARYDLGHYEEAETLLSELQVEWAGLGPQATLALTHLAIGDETSAQRVLTSMDSEVDAFAVGLVHLALGEIDLAFERFFESQYLNDWACLAIHHFYRDIWQSVEGDPRHEMLVRQAHENHGLDASNPL